MWAIHFTTILRFFRCSILSPPCDVRSLAYIRLLTIIKVWEYLGHSANEADLTRYLECIFLQISHRVAHGTFPRPWLRCTLNLFWLILNWRHQSAHCSVERGCIDWLSVLKMIYSSSIKAYLFRFELSQAALIMRLKNRKNISKCLHVKNIFLLCKSVDNFSFKVMVVSNLIYSRWSCAK